MKFTKKNILAQATVAATLFTAVGTLPFGQAVVTQAEEVGQVTSANPTADTTSKRSISIWKYQVRDASELGERGEGSYETVDKDVIPGIKFKVQRVLAVGDVSLTNPREQKLETEYTIDSEYAEQIITTDVNGKAYLDLGIGRTNDGIYLVTELTDDRTDLTATAGKRVETPADPFFVHVPQTSRTDLSSLIYDVQVQPKNILESLVNPDKTINNLKGDSVHAGQEFQWELAAKVPAGLWQIAAQDGTIDVYDAQGNIVRTSDMVKGEPIVIRDATGLLQPNFSMTDQLDNQLIYKKDSAKVQVKAGETGTWTDLESTDYTVSFDEATNTLKTTLTEAGLVKVGTASNGFTDIRTVLTTTVKENWNGILDNNFTINYQIPGQKPKTVTPPEENKPKYYTGGFDIEKTAEDTKAVLADAEFMIAFTLEDAEAEKFIASDGKAYDKGATLPDGVHFLVAKSDANGRAEFDGLALDWKDANADGLVQEDEVSRKYWVVETKAPEGYELLKAPVSVTVNLTTEKNDSVELDIVDKPKTDLPFTGGQGTTLLVAIALGAITIGTVAISVDKKRRQA
ncbi:SpaH/EbpB family LPXTG-anchored major pilin [Enterococcus sp. AZ194]|uniref:SpaH/EbpB family LPXTG-anchored major pilin n=1 Tax=Enterococcus sp. AZ194 TaxID=2774629 RepID=UPI003F686E9B